MKKLILIILSSLPILGFAQLSNEGVLTVFSEDGDKFTLILNGEAQNEVPQSNIRIEELPQPYYSAKIVFEDKTIKEISKKNLMLTDADGKMMEMTYKIRRDKKKNAKLSFYSMIPVREDFMVPAGVYVHQYGQPFNNNQNYNHSNGSQNNGGTLGANVNLPGMSVSIAINDTKQTTSTSSSSQTQNGSTTYSQSGNNYTGNCKGFPMSATDFSAALRTIKESSFDETKLTTANSIASSNCLSTDQVVEICKLFSFEDNKLAFAKYAYKYTTDPKNYFKVNNVFSFSSSKEELSDFVRNGGR